MADRVTHGSPEHFQQVVDAHVVSTYGPNRWCRCGANVPDYRAHIAAVWAPYALPDGWHA
ncbi:hypothetical protein [Cellulosimicrobium sp. TH-20]|uniref:hypothetical protein n=1 Tax=Cellulosimicrobium sp. TH-20 TaxID=1980001 RepID=UPI0011A410C7|nr:hypothetical protein [Cellulosimicrobium sp. TH-20]